MSTKKKGRNIVIDPKQLKAFQNFKDESLIRTEGITGVMIVDLRNKQQRLEEKKLRRIWWRIKESIKKSV